MWAWHLLILGWRCVHCEFFVTWFGEAARKPSRYNGADTGWGQYDIDSGRLNAEYWFVGLSNLSFICEGGDVGKRS